MVQAFVRSIIVNFLGARSLFPTLCAVAALSCSLLVPASAHSQSQGQLRASEALARQLPGSTLVYDTSQGRLIVYLAPDEVSYGSDGLALPWRISGSELCYFQQRRWDCNIVAVDDAGRGYIYDGRSSAWPILDIVKGDAANLVAQARMGQVLQLFDLFGGFGGGSSGSGGTTCFGTPYNMGDDAACRSMGYK